MLRVALFLCTCVLACTLSARHPNFRKRFTSHAEHLSQWSHSHAFDIGNAAGERGTRLVLWITAITMLIEISAGWWTGSMALLADGWHMSSHALAIGLSALAYGAARRYANDPRFAFGTWKIEVLAGFASAIFLLGVAAMMAFGSVERMFTPQPIAYAEAVAVAVLGLVVNVICATILGNAAGHAHGHSHSHRHPHGTGHSHGESDAHGAARTATGTGKDLNLQSAYVHVLTDAATSVLAIAALLGGWWAGWSWLDPAMGLVGAVLVAV